MIQNFADIIRAIEDLIDRGLIETYAIGGAVAALVWDEVTTTFDLDVFVLLKPRPTGLINMQPIYDWAQERDFPTEREHIKISGVPVQFVEAPNALTEEAIQEAAHVPIDGVSARVIKPEYLIAMWLTPPANDYKRKERASRLRMSSRVDTDALKDLLIRYDLHW